MERRKGVDLLADIAGPLLEQFDVTFVLAGDDLFGHLATRVLPVLAARPLKGSVHWLGALGLADVRQLVKATDIFLSPSLWENCPYSCLEAMAAGRAIVAADQGGMPEMIQDGVSGLLATPGDAQSFVRQLERIVGDRDLGERLGRGARRAIEDRHLDTQVAQQALVVYRSVVAGRTDGVA
jgi:glycosyltransferase involved in cell wall biosynthesis